MNDEHGPAARPQGADAGAQPQADDAGAQPDAELGAAEEERLRAVVEELRRLRVQDLALDMAVSLVTVGYQKLGLTEQTRALRDLDDARLAIELLRACLDALERERGAAGLADLRSTLAAMQLNYARAVDAEAPGGDRAGEAQPDGEEPSGGESPEGAPAAEGPADDA